MQDKSGFKLGPNDHWLGWVEIRILSIIAMQFFTLFLNDFLTNETTLWHPVIEVVATVDEIGDRSVPLIGRRFEWVNKNDKTV